MNLPDWLLNIIRCPETKEPLKFEEDYFIRKDGVKYFIKDGIISLVYPFNLSAEDKKWNKFYDFFAPFYDFNERFWGKLLFGVNVKKERKRIISLLNLFPGMRVLEVSTGPGVYQEHIRKMIGENGDLVAVDLSFGMLKLCKRKQKKLNTFLIQANGSYLPFEDNSFDAVFHFGGVNLFNEPQRAINEFIRVAKTGGVVSWGDEGLSENLKNDKKTKILLKFNPGYLKERPLIPNNLKNVKEYQVFGGYAYLVVGVKMSADSAFEKLI